MTKKSGYSNGILRYPVSVVDHNKTLIDPQLEEIQEVIPEEASPDNMLATDDNVATSSATFRGTSEPGLTEQQFLAWADSLEKDKNDYCNWLTTEDGKTIYKRYKYNGTEWAFEYNVADPSSIPTALSQLTDDATHRLVTDTEKATWNGKANPSDIPTELSQLSSDATHRLVTDTEKGAWNDKAEVGTSADPKTANTVNGVKAFATDAVQTNAYFQQNLAAIMALSANSNAGTTTATTNPEWKVVYTDYEDKILLGKRQDNTWYFAADLDDVLDALIEGYGS